ncbi:MAG: AMIN domain-containing protein, partial [Candidatus Latescibacteria bacterium]|nr:AMIN domain-containing protein [Candidatus Latescibacterota bacterium]
MRWFLRIMLLVGLVLSIAGHSRSVGYDQTWNGKDGRVVADAKGTRDPKSSRWRQKVRQQNYSYVDSVRWWSSERSTRVVIDLKRKAKYSAHRLSNPARLYI